MTCNSGIYLSIRYSGAASVCLSLTPIVDNQTQIFHPLFREVEGRILADPTSPGEIVQRSWLVPVECDALVVSV